MKKACMENRNFTTYNHTRFITYNHTKIKTILKENTVMYFKNNNHYYDIVVVTVVYYKLWSQNKPWISYRTFNAATF